MHIKKDLKEASVGPQLLFWYLHCPLVVLLCWSDTRQSTSRCPTDEGRQRGQNWLDLWTGRPLLHYTPVWSHAPTWALLYAHLPIRLQNHSPLEVDTRPGTRWAPPFCYPCCTWPSSGLLPAFLPACVLHVASGLPSAWYELNLISRLLSLIKPSLSLSYSLFS